MATVIAIHQPNYLPWMGFFHKMIQSHTFVFLDDVPFTKNGIQNRNRIKTSDGQMWLTVPVMQKGLSGQMTYDVKINNNVDWGRKSWNAVCINYRKAPFFSKYADFLEDVYKREWLKLCDLNLSLIEFIMKEMGIEVETVLASQLGCSGKSTDLLIDICRKLSGSIYLSGKSGRVYLDEGKFRNSSLELKYHNFEHPVYSQLYGEFTPNLSVIDLMFNYGKNSIDIIKSQN